MEKRLRWHKAEVTVLWLIIAIGAVLTITGAGVYFYVIRLAIVEQPSLVSTKYFVIAQVKMLFDFAKALGVVFSLTGIAVIILALDRLSLTKAAYIEWPRLSGKEKASSCPNEEI